MIKNQAILPCEMSAETQITAQMDKRNFIYPYPLGIECHFPIFACHPVFSEFMDIILDRRREVRDRGYIIDGYNKFINDLNTSESRRIDECVGELIQMILHRENETEDVIPEIQFQI